MWSFFSTKFYRDHIGSQLSDLDVRFGPEAIWKMVFCLSVDPTTPTAKYWTRGEGGCGAKNLPQLLDLHDPGSPLPQKVFHWLTWGERVLLKLLLLTGQPTEHGAVEPRWNELVSFHDQHPHLSFVPIKSSTVPQLLLNLTALHWFAGCWPTTSAKYCGVGDGECSANNLPPGFVLCNPAPL